MTNNQPSSPNNITKTWSWLWRGQGSILSGFIKLIWGTVRLFLADWIWDTAIQLTHFQSPFKSGGVVFAIIGLLLFIWAMVGFGHGFFILGIRRLVITLLVSFGLLIIVNTLTIPDSRPLSIRIIPQLINSGSIIWDSTTYLIGSVSQRPDEFLFAYTGRHSPPQLPPGFPTPDPQAKPVEVVIEASDSPMLAPTLPNQVPALDTQQESTPLEQLNNLQIQVGRYAQVVNTDGDPLRARAGPGTQFEIVVRFPEGTRLLVLDGPESNGGFTWWKLKGEAGEGWCADQWLALIDD